MLDTDTSRLCQDASALAKHAGRGPPARRADGRATARPAHHSKRWSLLRRRPGRSAQPSAASSALYSRLGVVTSSSAGRRPASSAPPRRRSGLGSRCSTTSTSAAASAPRRPPHVPARRRAQGLEEVCMHGFVIARWARRPGAAGPGPGAPPRQRCADPPCLHKSSAMGRTVRRAKLKVLCRPCGGALPGRRRRFRSSSSAKPASAAASHADPLMHTERIIMSLPQGPSGGRFHCADRAHAAAAQRAPQQGRGAPPAPACLAAARARCRCRPGCTPRPARARPRRPSRPRR